MFCSHMFVRAFNFIGCYSSGVCTFAGTILIKERRNVALKDWKEMHIMETRVVFSIKPVAAFRNSLVLKPHVYRKVQRLKVHIFRFYLTAYESQAIKTYKTISPLRPIRP